VSSSSMVHSSQKRVIPKAEDEDTMLPQNVSI
jgi:hypothetical protein